MLVRQLRDEEIVALLAQGCSCERWELVKVGEPFDSSRYRNVTFVGNITLHPAVGEVALGALSLPAGIYNALIIHSTVGRGAHISNVGNYIANCTTGRGAIVRNVSTIDCPSRSTYGNGVEIEVLSETGGREVPMHYALTAQEAWLTAMCRHDPAVTERLKAAISAKAEESAGSHTIIGDGATVTDTGHINGVDIKPGARISGASRLVNGTVGEGAVVGTDVIASDFILARGATIDKGARLDHVFVGEGSCVSNGFSAHHSLLFSNCILENGESAALFAGPYTVSMHKSTLLIGAMTLMFNAGSGANQSNHLYKSGPCHHGVLERGVKLASDAYIMWPARIGAFSTVMGRHKSHPDTSALPFSYIVEAEGNTQVIPAIALGNIGIARDVEKWPRRDRRPDHPADIITFPLFNPYIGDLLAKGIETLTQLIANQPDATKYGCAGFNVKKSHAERGIKLYRDALFNYLTTTLLQRISDGMPLDNASFDSTMVDCDSVAGIDEWVDAAGMTIPAEMIAGDIPTPEEWRALYPALEWNWTVSRLRSHFGIDVAALGSDKIASILDNWLKINATFDAMLLSDAQKEYAPTSQLATGSFGVVTPDRREADFLNVRGTFEHSPLATLLNSRSQATHTLAQSVKGLL